MHALRVYLARQGKGRTGEQLGRLGLHACKKLVCTRDEFVNGVNVGGVEGKCDHGFHLVQLDLDHAVIVSTVLGSKGRVIFAAPVGFVECLGNVVGRPDRGKAGGLGGHDVNAVTEIHGEVRHAGANEFQNAVLYKAAGECRADKRKRDVMRANTATGRTGQIYQHHLGIGNVVGVLQQLLDQLGAAFANRHGAKRAVTGVRVRAQDHATA